MVINTITHTHTYSKTTYRNFSQIKLEKKSMESNKKKTNIQRNKKKKKTKKETRGVLKFKIIIITEHGKQNTEIINFTNQQRLQTSVTNLTELKHKNFVLKMHLTITFYYVTKR